MPWWGIAYLCVLVTLLIAGCWDNFRSAYCWWMQILGLSSAAFSILFVVAYFDQSIGDLIGYAIVPMIAMVVGWDVYELNRDLADLRRSDDMPERSQSRFEHLVVAIVGVVVIPAYLAGLAVAFRVFET